MVAPARQVRDTDRMTRPRFLVHASLSALLVVLASCASSDDTVPAGRGPGDFPADAPSGDDGGAGDVRDPGSPPIVNITVRGRAKEPLADGFVLLEAGCDDRSTPQEPSFGAFDVQVPADWEGTSASKDPAGGSVNFTIDGASHELSIGFEEVQQGSDPASVLESVSLGETLEPAFTVVWGGDDHQVYRAGDQYLAALPTFEADAVMSVPLVTQVRFGYGAGETDDIPQDDVRQVFESVTVLDCGLEPYLGLYPNAQVDYID